MRHIIIDNQTDVIYIDTARHNIGGNQNIDSSRLELVHYFLTLRLFKVGVHFNVQLHLLQGFGHLFHLQLGRSEDNDTFGVCSAKRLRMIPNFWFS